MLSLQNSAFSLIFVAILSGVTCEDLTPVKTEEFSSEGSNVTLSYKAGSGARYYFWYRQYPRKPPEFLISHSPSGTVGTNPIPGLKITVESNRINLIISSAAVTDSAVYYCALQPLNAGSGVYKMFFGGGTRLTVETKEESKPSYYKLEDKFKEEVCLATGFSSIRAADEEKKDIFNNRTGAVRIDGDTLYNQVAYLSTEQERKQCEADTISSVLKQNGSFVCNSMQPDPQVNLVSLTVLGLRLLFMKTVVFNVLLTLRLWITS